VLRLLADESFDHRILAGLRRPLSGPGRLRVQPVIAIARPLDPVDQELSLPL